MAYQTGTATSWINLLDALRLFATANGWTENLWALVGSDRRLHLQKGSIYANFLAEADDTELYIGGSLGFDAGAAWNAQPGNPGWPNWDPRMSPAFHGAITWPITYHLFLHTAPDSIEVIVRYQPSRYQWLMFGALTKYGTWTGGEYFGAPFETYNTAASNRAFQDQEVDKLTPVLFHRQGFGGSDYGNRNTALHAEFDSNIWWSSAVGSGVAGGATPVAQASSHVWPLVPRSASAFNGLMTLQPIIVFALRPDGLWSPLGRVEHLRYCNVLNHNAGDIIDIGGQRWMVFPWLEKGGPTDASPSTLHAGMAIKYDGP